MHQKQKDCKIITRVTIIELKTEIHDLLSNSISTGLKSEFVKDSKKIRWFSVLTQAGAAGSVFETYRTIEIVKFKIVRAQNVPTYRFGVSDARDANKSIAEKFVDLRESRDPK